MLGGPVADFLSDVRELMGGAVASLWDATDPAAPPVLLHFSSADERAPILDEKASGLVAWAAQQGAGEMCTDGDTVRFAATPLATVDDLRLVLMVSGGARPLSMPRDQIRAWLPRLGARVQMITDLLKAQAAGNRAEKHADLLLLTAAQLQEQRSVDALGASLCSAASHMTGSKRVALVRWQAGDSTGVVAYATRGHLVTVGWPVSATSDVGHACGGDKAVIMEPASSRAGGSLIYGGSEPERRLETLTIIPLRGAEGVIGALVAEGDAPNRASPTDAKNLRLLGILGAAALETVWEIEEINRRARTDALTGLANRQQFEERLTRIVTETNRFGGSCTLIVIDIDRFKHVNDTFGHQIGDQVLQRVATVLQQAVRTVDLCARYGGEEMALLLPQTDLEGGCQLAERLRQSIGDRPYVIQGREIPITISLGVAAYPEGAGDRDDLFAAADRALYSAKRAGRNKVVSGAV